MCQYDIDTDDAVTAKFNGADKRARSSDLDDRVVRWTMDEY